MTKLREFLKNKFQNVIDKNQDAIFQSIQEENTSQTTENLSQNQPTDDSSKTSTSAVDQNSLPQNTDIFSEFKEFSANPSTENTADNSSQNKGKKSYSFTPRKSKANQNATKNVKKYKKKNFNLKIAKKAQIVRQLSILLDSGMDLRSSLAILEEQEVSNRNIWFFIHDLFTKIEAGDSLSDALSSSTVHFNESEIAMVKAGEATGRQAATLAQMASLMEKKVFIKKKITSAMIYPATILVVSSVVVLLLTTFVVPKFEKVIADQLGEDKMPALTDFIVKASRFVSSHLFEFLTFAGVVFFFFFLAKTVNIVKKQFHLILLKIPLIGECINQWSIVLFSRTFGDLLLCGCSVIESLKMAKESVGNYYMKMNLVLTINDVQQGLSLTESLRRRTVFPAMAEGLIKVGEESGKLGDIMEIISTSYEEQLDELISRLTSLLEPLLVIFLSFFVGSVVIGLFLPLVSLIQNISG